MENDQLATCTGRSDLQGCKQLVSGRRPKFISLTQESIQLRPPIVRSLPVLLVRYIHLTAKPTLMKGRLTSVISRRKGLSTLLTNECLYIIG